MTSVPFQSVVLTAERFKNQVDLVCETAARKVAVFQAQCAHDYRFTEDHIRPEARSRGFVVIRLHDSPDPDFGNVAFHHAVCLLCSNTKMVYANICPICFSNTQEVPREEAIAMADIGQELVRQQASGILENEESMLWCTSILACISCGFRIALLHYYK